MALSNADRLVVREVMRRATTAAERVFDAPSLARSHAVIEGQVGVGFNLADRSLVAGEAFSVDLLSAIRRPGTRRQSARRGPQPPLPDPVHALLCAAVSSVARPRVAGLHGEATLLQLEYAHASEMYAGSVSTGVSEFAVLTHRGDLLRAFGSEHLTRHGEPRVRHPAAVEAIRELSSNTCGLMDTSLREEVVFLARCGLSYGPLWGLSVRMLQAATGVGRPPAWEVRDLLTRVGRGFAGVAAADLTALSAEIKRERGTAAGRRIGASLQRLVRDGPTRSGRRLAD